MAARRNRKLRAFLLGALLVLVAGGGALVYMETASVRVEVSPRGLEAYVVLSSRLNGGVLPTQRFQAQVTDTQRGNASWVQVGATYSSGFVRFTYSCTTQCAASAVVIPVGTAVTDTRSLVYMTMDPATIQPPGGSASVAVRASEQGARWNAPPQTLTSFAGDNSYGTDLTVTNPSAISGGLDGRPALMIQQSDYDAVVTALNAKVSQELGAALFAKAQGSDYVGDPHPVITVVSDHAVGDETPTFTITITAADGATAFSEYQANAIMLAALKAKVPAGQKLTDDRIQYIYQSNQAAPGADIVVTGKADGYILPTLSAESVRSQVRGLSATEAARSLQRAAPGSRVEIRISPPVVPWLPVVGDHISVTLSVRQAHP